MHLSARHLFKVCIGIFGKGVGYMRGKLAQSYRDVIILAPIHVLLAACNDVLLRLCVDWANTVYETKYCCLKTLVLYLPKEASKSSCEIEWVLKSVFLCCNLLQVALSQKSLRQACPFLDHIITYHEGEIVVKRKLININIVLLLKLLDSFTT